MALGRTLGLEVVAEGIERPGQAVELAALGCHIAQGFLYGRPVDPGTIGPWPPVSVADWSTGSRLAPVSSPAPAPARPPPSTGQG